MTLQFRGRGIHFSWAEAPCWFIRPEAYATVGRTMQRGERRAKVYGLSLFTGRNHLFFAIGWKVS